MAGFAAKTMIYRGLGSGIVRAMREDNHIDFDNEVSANQFKVTIWRTTQNNKSSTQKKPLKDSNTIQKESNTIQKSDTTTQKKPLKDSRTSQNAENGGYPPTQNGDIRSLFWLFSLMALQN